MSTVDPQSDEAVNKLQELVNKKGDMHDVAQELLSSKKYLTDLRIRLEEHTLPVALELELWRHKFGKPADTVRIAGHDGGPLKAIELRVVDPSD